MLSLIIHIYKDMHEKRVGTHMNNYNLKLQMKNLNKNEPIYRVV